MSKINKVAIYGMGKSGKAALRLANLKGWDVYAVNQGPRKEWYQTEKLEGLIPFENCFSEEDFRKQFGEMDEIIISPGIPVEHPCLELARKNNVKLSSEIEFAYRESRTTPVIAITGTNGKTTTTTMITEALELFGKKVFCGGNIGIPYCELPLSGEKFDFAVIEVSSFQLETIQEFHPQIGLILNISPNHSERYSEVRAYAQAKFRLLLNMTEKDHLILGKENDYLEEIQNHKVSKEFFSKGHLPSDFISQFSFVQSPLKGEHNEANFYATYCVLRLLGLENLNERFQFFINTFKGVPHRLEFVTEKNGLMIYNDAKSTNILATKTALKAFSGSHGPCYLILGGKLRSEGDRLLEELLVFKPQITKIFTIGEVTERLFHELKNDFQVEMSYELKNVFQKVREEKLVGNLIFSPAFPSFDQFKNYVDRGEKFKKLALEYF
jgi:UDP-N-acetylmuramoylalanine--D-glutamate ligase